MEALAAGSQDAARPSLLPSALSKDDAFSPHAEGYEGDRLHEMFLSARARDTDVPTASQHTESAGESRVPVQSSEVADPKPLFVIVEDAITGEQGHPHVHYVFSDDDSNLLTHAALQAVDMTGSHDDARISAADTSQPEACGERTIIVDMNVDGRTVTSAQSLSHTWQVVETSVDRAPAFDTKEREDGAGSMLRIVGTQHHERGDQSAQLPSSGVDNYTQAMISNIEELAQEFESSMAQLRRLTATYKHKAEG